MSVECHEGNVNPTDRRMVAIIQRSDSPRVDKITLEGRSSVIE